MILVDVGYLSFKLCSYPNTFRRIDKLAEMGATFCFDSPYSLRMEAYSWYKGNRAGFSADALALKRKAHEYQDRILKSYTDQCRIWHGAEGDDVVAERAWSCKECIVLSSDHDMLQIPGAFLVDQHFAPWGIDRLKLPARLKPRAGEWFLAHQLIYGCATDLVPRRIFTYDRTTGPYCLSQPSPLRAAIGLLPEQHVMESLDCLLMPTPLLTGENPITVALERYPEVNHGLE